MAGGKGKSIGGKATGAKDSGAKPQKSHSAKAGLQVCLLLRQHGDDTLLARLTTYDVLVLMSRPFRDASHRAQKRACATS